MKVKYILNGIIFIYAFFFVVLNGFLLASTAVMATTAMVSPSPTTTQTQQSQGPTNAQVASVVAQVIPAGIPPVYGSELNVNFSNPVASLTILDGYDRGANKIDLQGDALARYIKIAMKTACEFCCGAKTLVFKDGSPACGCAHSAAMRGVAKYLIQKHGTEFTDEQILTEVNKWKAISFPKQTVERALASAGGSSSVNLPSQVGGC